MVFSNGKQQAHKSMATFSQKAPQKASNPATFHNEQKKKKPLGMAEASSWRQGPVLMERGTPDDYFRKPRSVAVFSHVWGTEGSEVISR